MDELKKQLVEQIGRLSGRLDEMEATRERRVGNSNTSTISVNAGGLGVWMCVSACAVMLAMSIVGGMWMSRELNRVDRELTDRREAMDRMQTYLSAIYAQAPHLQPQSNDDAD